MSYLTEEEIPQYCGLISGVTMEHIEASSALIDAYKGCTFEPVERTERIDLTYKRTTNETRGKISHFPIVTVHKLKGRMRSPFGNELIEMPEDVIEFDSDSSPYFTFYMPRGLMFRALPKSLIVEYTSGYAEVPEAIKRACGILACNIKQMGGVMRWKSRDDYDIKVTLGNEGVFTEEIKAIVRGVEVK